MNFSLLKRLRVGLAIFFLVLLVLLFVDFRKSFSKEFYEWAVSLQFVPAMLKSYFLPGVDVLSITFNSAYALLEEYTVPSYARWEFCRMSFHGFRENEEKKKIQIPQSLDNWPIYPIDHGYFATLLWKYHLGNTT